MYVAEWRTYMQDIKGTGTDEPVSQVVRLEDTDGDGIMDHKTVFAQDLILPRMILPLLDSVLIGESNTNDIYEYFARDHDGVAEEKKIWFEGGKRGGNVEHQPSGLIWSMDNWLYMTYSDYRLRLRDGKVIKGETKGNRGQWGLTQDNHGKVLFVDAGAGIGPAHPLFTQNGTQSGSWPKVSGKFSRSTVLLIPREVLEACGQTTRPKASPLPAGKLSFVVTDCQRN